MAVELCRYRAPFILLASFVIFAALACGGAGPSPAATPSAIRAPAAASTTEVAASADSPATTPAVIATTDASDGHLRIGFLADFTGPLAEFGSAIHRGAELAVQHVNAAGGVGGRDVILITGDTRVDPTVGVEEARRLIDVEGVHAIVGPLTSTVALAVTESVAAGARVPVVTPSATSPALASAEDDGFLFRSTVSDAAQGVVLAMLATEERYASAAILYRDDAYGQGLTEAFERAYSGSVVSASYSASGQLSYLAELQRVAADGAEVLIAIGFPGEAIVFIREAIDNELFSRFLFVDGTKSQDLIDVIGGEYLDGSKGTAPGSAPDTPSSMAWADAYVAVYGALPTLPFVREAYDATIAIALAAESAGSLDGSDLRDQLTRVSSPGGEMVFAGLEGVALALDLVRSGVEINYEGSATSLDWNEAGDVTSGYVTIWEYSAGTIVTIEGVSFTIE